MHDMAPRSATSSSRCTLSACIRLQPATNDRSLFMQKLKNNQNRPTSNRQCLLGVPPQSHQLFLIITNLCTSTLHCIRTPTQC